MSSHSLPQSGTSSARNECKCISCGKCGNPGTIDGMVLYLEALCAQQVGEDDFARLSASYAAIGFDDPYRLGVKGEDMRYLVLPERPERMQLRDEVTINFAKIDGIWSPSIENKTTGLTHTWEKYIA